MAQIKEVFFEKFGRILDIFFPRRCEVCGKVNPNGQYGFICDECAKGIYLITGGRCLRCAEIIGPNSAPNATFCHKCLDKPPAFNWGYSCSVFDGAIRELMHGLKYRNAYYLRSDIIRIMKAATPTKHFLENAILIPVPLHHSRKLKRKYNQAGSNRRMRTHGIPRREHYSFKCIKARTQNQYANTAIEETSGKHKGRICDTGKFYARNKKIRTHRHSGRCYDERGDDFGMCANFKTRGL